MKTYNALIFSLLSLGFLACENVEILPPQVDTSSQAIINGTLDTRKEHNAAVTLYLSMYGTRSHFCTGTLIAPQYVLTAAHCVKDLPGDEDATKIEPLKSYIRVGVGTRTNSATGGYTVSSYHPHSKYGSSNKGYDIAILKLSNPVPTSVAVPIPPLPPSKSFNKADFARTIPIEIVGYGQTIANDNNSSGTKYYIKLNALGVCGLPDVAESKSSCSVSFPYSTPWGTLYYTSNKGGACFGDSGGPVFYVHEGVEYVAGVTSFGYGENCDFIDVATRVSDFYPFIESLVPGLPVEKKEVCDNNIDDNGDGRIDCDDPYCFALTQCIPEICNNKKDDNGDNLVDCEDPKCKSFPACKPEVCDNNIDDNGDTLIDCKDPQCDQFQKCLPEVCNNNIDDNGDTLIDCKDPTCDRVIFCQKEHCSNGIDDNADTIIDCDDPQCQETAACKPENCYNGIDDNGDTRADCDDPQCYKLVQCKPENCSNGIDDNDNGLIDCDDPRCTSEKVCKPEICDNEVDDNANGLIDCLDPACMATGECITKFAESCSLNTWKPKTPSWPLLLILLAPLALVLRRRKEIEK